MRTPSKEKLLDLALERELKSSETFRSWILGRTRFAGESAVVTFLRADWPWGKVNLRVWSPITETYTTVAKEGETDLLVVFQSKERGRFALHIENKLSAGHFTDYQPDLYRSRASAWSGNPAYGDYEEWETVLVAPDSFYQRNLREARKFDRFISHTDLAAFVPEFGS